MIIEVARPSRPRPADIHVPTVAGGDRSQRMFDGFLNGSELISTLTLVFGSLAGYRAGQLVHRHGPKALRRSARSTLILLSVALFGVFALLAFSIGLLSYGWIFASNRFAVALPPMIIATAFSIIWSGSS
ncbi:hypothetical protein ONA70_29485, partial [Micromonospora yasonensis]|uniref:hypothetical protein n=1 Tax=Micromonospora yasonensis TaxID=1128667 RepID=UPI00222E3D5D